MCTNYIFANNNKMSKLCSLCSIYKRLRTNYAYTSVFKNYAQLLSTIVLG